MKMTAQTLQALLFCHHSSFRGLIKQAILSQWKLDRILDAISCNKAGFPSCALFKSSFQSLYNAMKGGLDANTQQYMSIRPNVKVSFEQTYVICMLLANASNSWRGYQLLQLSDDIEDMSLSQLKHKL